LLNYIISKTNAKIVLISTWTDLHYSIEHIIDFLHKQGCFGQIINIKFPAKENDQFIIPMSKDEKIKTYLDTEKNVDKFVIIDDGNISPEFSTYHVKPNSTAGLTQSEADLTTSILY
jgi:hypothetical protein